nr:ribonuclease domain-containing protein [Wenzhouxiangella sp. XN79A]
MLVLALLAWIAVENPSLLEQAPDAGGPQVAQPDNADAAAPVIRDVVVRDLDGRVAWRGDMDLGPAIARIERGEPDRHRNDGSTFQNREGRLPSKPRGYYREFVVRTPGMRGVGPQRLVVGRDGDAWYTSDHYRSFVRLNIEVRPP